MKNIFKGLLLGGVLLSSGLVSNTANGQIISQVGVSASLSGGSNYGGFPSTTNMQLSIANYDPVNEMNPYAILITLTLPPNVTFPGSLGLPLGWTVVGAINPQSVQITNSAAALTNASNILGSQTSFSIPLNITGAGSNGIIGWGTSSNVAGQFQNPQTGLAQANVGNNMNTSSMLINVQNNNLPVDFMYFNAKANGCAVDVNWATAMEKNNKMFEVERSADGIKFSKIGEVNGAGNSSIETKYQYVDRTPANGHNIYRIRQVDFDGKSTLSATANVKLDCNTESISIYPNPTEGLVYVKGLTNKGTINVYNVVGQLVITKKVENTVEGLNLSNLAAGSYHVQVVANDAVVFTSKIVKN